MFARALSRRMLGRTPVDIIGVRMRVDDESDARDRQYCRMPLDAASFKLDMVAVLVERETVLVHWEEMLVETKQNN